MYGGWFGYGLGWVSYLVGWVGSMKIDPRTTLWRNPMRMNIKPFWINWPKKKIAQDCSARVHYAVNCIAAFLVFIVTYKHTDTRAPVTLYFSSFEWVRALLYVVYRYIADSRSADSITIRRTACGVEPGRCRHSEGCFRLQEQRLNAPIMTATRFRSGSPTAHWSYDPIVLTLTLTLTLTLSLTQSRN